MKKIERTNMPTLTDGITEIMKDIKHMEDVNWGETGYTEEAIDNLLSLIQSTVKGCLPEKVEKEETNCGDGCCHDIFYSGGYAFTSDEEMEGFNQAIDTINANLKERGLL